MPELDRLLIEAEKEPDQVHEGQLKTKINGKNKIFHILVSLDFSKGEIRGFIINFLPVETNPII